jgi:ligand-binding sensor domain-containing protein/two-component sensor histidine kinase
VWAKFYFVFFLWVISLNLSCFEEMGNFIVREWQTEEGLPQNSVNAVLQSRDGYIWIGTQEGLARFDGSFFKIYNMNSVPEMISQLILCVTEDMENALWVGTFGGGLYRLKDNVLTSYLSPEKLPAKNIRCLFIDGHNALWIGTEGEGLWYFENDSFLNFKLPTASKEVTVRSIIKDRKGNLWVGTEKTGLFKIRKNEIESYSTHNLLSDDNIYAILEDIDNSIWIGTGKGLCKYSEGVFETFKTKNGLSNDLIQCLFQDKDNNIWVGTNNKGAYILSRGKVYPLNLNEDWSNKSILSIYQDREASIWLGTSGYGLMQLIKGKVLVYDQKKGLASNLIFTMTKGKTGEMWIGTAAGLSCYKDGVFKNFTFGTRTSSKMVISMNCSKDGELWFGTNGGGLGRFDNGKFTIFTVKEGLASNFITAIQEDERGRILVGTRGGLSIFEKGRFKNYSYKDGLASDVIYTLLYDDDEGLWIGTREGLCHLQDGKIMTYTTNEGLSNNIVISLFKDKDGVLWVGTYGGGLNRLKNGKLNIVRKMDGLFDDVVFQIIEDRIGNLWMSSNNGIFYVSKKDINDYIEAKAKTFYCKSFTVVDGLLSSECNGGSQPAGCLAPDGMIWFPTIKGAAVINPFIDLDANTTPPPVKIEEVYVNGLVQHTNLYPPGKGDLEFHYTALSYIAPQKVLFKYKLDGYDDKWIDAGNRRVAYYTNIPPGQYSFIVKACNNDGIWNEKGSSYSFLLKPHYYQTAWFRLLILLIMFMIFGFSFFLFYRIRMKVMKAETDVLEERNRMAREIHDTIAQGLQGIVILLQIAESKRLESSEAFITNIQKACWLARETLQEARHSVLSLREIKDQKENFSSFLKTKITPIIADSNIDFVFEKAGSEPNLSSNEEFNLMRIVQEAVRNAVKHSSPKSIMVNLNYTDDKLELTILDDGKGFKESTIKQSEEGAFGIIGMKERAKNIGAEISIISEPGKGTSVKILFKMSKRRKNGKQ